MNDGWIDELRAERVASEPRPGFQDELRRMLDAEWDGRTTQRPSRKHRRRI